MSFEIYYADLGKAVGIPEIGIRPIVCVRKENDYIIAYKITGRMRPDFRHIKMNQYMISGFCDISKFYKVHVNFIKSYKRDCTKSEIDTIKPKISKTTKIIEKI